MSCLTLGCAPPSGTQYHCPACHATLGTLTMFDEHQDVDYTRDPAVICRAPAGVQGPSGVWYTPEGLKDRERRRVQLAGLRHD